MSVKLRKRVNKDGSTSLYLDIYHNGERRYEFLKNLKLSKASNPRDRQTNKENMDLANKIALKRAHDISSNDYDVIPGTGRKTIVVDWMQAYIDTYNKKDKRNMQGALNRFKAFLIEHKNEQLTFGRLNEVIISDFKDYLMPLSKGEGASSYFNRFKKMVRRAYKIKLIDRNPAEDITAKGKAARKASLSLDEIKTLSGTPTESSEIRRAFLFSCVTGLRWIDVKSLQWSCIDINDKLMNVQQSKTGEDLSTPLNDTAIKLLGKPGEPGQYVFTLPTANGANKTLKAWVKRAGINKAITWHNARHSFGTNLIYNNVDVLTASKLLGHTSMKHTQRYVKSAAELKERATDKLNIDL